MSIRELNREQLIEVKERLLIEMSDEDPEFTVSWYDLSIADELITDDYLYKYYVGYTFGKDDFFCNQ